MYLWSTMISLLSSKVGNSFWNTDLNLDVEYNREGFNLIGALFKLKVPQRKQAFKPQVLGRLQKVNTFTFWSFVQGRTASATVPSNMGWMHWQWMCFFCIYVGCLKQVFFCIQNKFSQKILCFWCLDNPHVMESKVSYSRHMDLHSGMGFLTAFQALRRVVMGGLIWLGLPCCSYIWLSRGTTRRCRLRPRGCKKLRKVRMANRLVRRVCYMLPGRFHDQTRFPKKAMGRNKSNKVILDLSIFEWGVPKQQ